MSHTHEVTVKFEVYATDDRHAARQVQFYLDHLRLNGVAINEVKTVAPPKENGDEQTPSD